MTISSANGAVASQNYNAIMNSNFTIWQRAANQSSPSIPGGTATYVADRWMGYRGAYAAGSTYSRQAAGIDGFRYCMRVQRDSGNTATNPIFLDQPIDTDTSVPMQGKVVTISFYARAGAGYSSAASTLGFAVYGGTGIDQKAVSGFTNQVTMHNSVFTLTNNFQRFYTSFTVGSMINGFTPEFFYTPSGTAGASDYFEITGVQLETGSYPTAYKSHTPSTATELAVCQRYYQRYSGDAGAFVSGTYYTSTSFYGTLIFPEMRAIPVGSASSVDAFTIFSGNGSAPSTAIYANQVTTKTVEIFATSIARTAGNGGWVRLGTNSYFELRAEL